MADFPARLNDFLLETYDDSPVLASSLGLEGYDDRLEDLSERAFEEREARSAAWLRAFEATPDAGLSAADQIDRDLALSVLRGRAIMADWQMWRRQPAEYLAGGLGGVFSLFLHRLRPEPELARAAVARLRAVPQNLADGKRNLRAELTPRLYVERAIGQTSAGAAYARDLVPAEVSDPGLRAELAEAGARAADAYEDFGRFLADLREGATGEWAIGEERYSRLLREKEVLGYGAAEMRERGRVEWDRLAEDLRRSAQTIARTDDWQSVLHSLNADHPPTPEAMRAAYEDWTERARRFLKERNLVTFPEGERCLVEPSPPYQRPVIAVASYQRPPAFSNRLIGHFFVPFPPDGVSEAEVQQRLETNSHAAIPDVTVHEAYPGHHWHMVTAKANPRAVRQVFSTAYFSEGWGLYSERLMREQGFFQDPRHEMFQYEGALFRAARIIVDTGLHMGEIDFDEGVRFMVERGNLSEATARAEVGRYCSWPTQASSYLTGCLEILRIRDRYLAQSTEHGVDALRSFHDALCGSGTGLPIGLAERAVMATLS